MKGQEKSIKKPAKKKGEISEESLEKVSGGGGDADFRVQAIETVAYRPKGKR